MSWVQRTFSSSIGSKWMMAISGAALVGFLVAHLSGNLLIFVGRDALNAYAKGLHDLGPLLWVARIGLLVFVLMHIFTAMSLMKRNREAKPQKYAVNHAQGATYASRTMVMSGPIITLYIIYHLAHFTFKAVHVDEAAVAMETLSGGHAVDVYQMMVDSFSVWWITLFYLIANLLICVHLHHGIQSAFQTLGLNHPKFTPLLKQAGAAIAVLIAVGFVSIPLAVLTGVVQ